MDDIHPPDAAGGQPLTKQVFGGELGLLSNISSKPSINFSFVSGGPPSGFKKQVILSPWTMQETHH